MAFLILSKNLNFFITFSLDKINDNIYIKNFKHLESSFFSSSRNLNKLYLLLIKEMKTRKRIGEQKWELHKKVCEEVGISEEVEGARMEEIITKKDGKKEIIYRKKTGMYKKHELVSSHICRRSFATNIYGKIDTLTIMKITGHKTEAQFLNYIK